MGKGEKTRAQVVTRAVTLTYHVGLEGLSLGMLASELGLSKSGLFAHFASKEALQLDVVQEVVDRFTKAIVLPALTKLRGEPRIRALFDNYLAWMSDERGGIRGCILTQLLYEYADRDGPIRDRLLAAERAWLETLARACRIAVEERHFKPSVDADHFAYEMLGIFSVYQHARRFLEDPLAEERAIKSFAYLTERHRTPRRRPSPSRLP